MIFLAYRAIQFISKIYYVYSNAKNQFDQQTYGNQGQQRKQYGKTTIHYQDKNSNGQSKHKTSKDEDYIDFEEVKE